jgi:hypothetical protein
MLIATGFTSRAGERHFRHESVARLAVRVGMNASWLARMRSEGSCMPEARGTSKGVCLHRSVLVAPSALLTGGPSEGER